MTGVYCNVQDGSRAHPASYPMGTRVLSLGVNQLGYEADHSPPSSNEVTNVSYISAPPYVYMMWCGA
jgi:hypothetical protein